MTPQKTVLITGAGKRIGRSIALSLARAGWAVGVHYNRSAGEAKQLVDEIAALGGRAVAVQADLADAEATMSLMPRTNAALGPVHALINNASMFEMDTIRDATLQSWNDHIDINLRAPFLLTQAFAAQFPDEAEDGNVINIIDQRVRKLTPYFASYTVSKTGLWTLTQTCAMALAPRIRVNAIGPGPTLASVHQTPEEFARQQRSTPLQRGAGPEEIADGVLFLLGARSMTGQMLAMDGGQHLPWPAPHSGKHADD